MTPAIHIFSFYRCFSSFPWSQFINQLINQSFKSWTWSKSSGTSRAHRVFFLKILCHSKGKILFGMCFPQTIVAFMRKSLQTYSWPYCQCWDRSFSYLLFNNIFLLKNLFFQKDQCCQVRIRQKAKLDKKKFFSQLSDIFHRADQNQNWINISLVNHDQ